MKKNRTKKMIISSILVCTMVLAGGCKMENNEKIPIQNVLSASYPSDSSKKDVEMSKAQKASKLINKFSAKTAAKILSNQSDDSNKLYSPISLYYALAIATEGAQNNTEKEFLELLNIEDKNELGDILNNLYKAIYSDEDVSKLKIANSLWLNDKNNIEYKQNYIDKIKKDYYASLFLGDLGTEEARAAISEWVLENTNNTLDYQGVVSPETMIKILNTIYFYDSWSEPFSESLTEKDEFKLSNGDKIECDFMAKSTSREYIIADEYKSSSLDFLNGSKMVFVLPNEGVEVSDLISSPEKIEEMFSNDKSSFGMVNWEIPKFSYKASLDLIATLESLGIKDAFGSKADFRGIADEDLFISEIEQNTYISLDEKGVEASAYTEIGLKCGMAPEINEPVEMKLDRPFIYGIVSNDGSMLFMGVCNNPNKK